MHGPPPVRSRVWRVGAADAVRNGNSKRPRRWPAVPFCTPADHAGRAVGTGGEVGVSRPRHSARRPGAPASSPEVWGNRVRASGAAPGKRGRGLGRRGPPVPARAGQCGTRGAAALGPAPSNIGPSAHASRRAATPRPACSIVDRTWPQHLANSRNRCESSRLAVLMASERTTEICCPICVHTVPGRAVLQMRVGRASLRVAPGQFCPHCGAVLDAGVVLFGLDAGRRTTASTAPVGAARRLPRGAVSRRIGSLQT